MDRETMDSSEGKKTTIYEETMDPREGGKTNFKDSIAKGKEFLKNYFAKLEAIWMLELAELKAELEKLANLYREDSGMNFDGENIQGKEAIRAKLTSLKPSRIQVLNIECLPVGGTDLSSGLYGMVCGYIWLNRKQDARFFSQTFSLHPTPEGSFVISNSIFIHIGMESYGAGTGTMRPSPFP